MQCETLLRALAQRNCLVPIYSCRQRDNLVSMRLIPPPPMMSTAASAVSVPARCSTSVLFPPTSSGTALFTTAAGGDKRRSGGLHAAKSVLSTICGRALSTTSHWREAEPPPAPAASPPQPPRTTPSANEERALQMVSVHFNYGLPQFTVPLPARYSMMM